MYVYRNMILTYLYPEQIMSLHKLHTLELNGIIDTKDVQKSRSMLIAMSACSPSHAISSGAAMNALLPAAPRC